MLIPFMFDRFLHIPPALFCYAVFVIFSFSVFVSCSCCFSLQRAIQGLAKQGSKNRQEFVARGAAAYQQLVEMLRDGAGAKGSQGPSAGEGVEATSASALYDLGLNYLLRARLLCADSGEGSGLWAMDVYERLPGVEDLAR